MDVSLEFLQERYALSIEKIRRIAVDCCGDFASGKADTTDGENAGGTDIGDAVVTSYFARVAEFICLADDFYRFVLQNGLNNASPETLQDWNHRLYRDILPGNYNGSFADPAYAAAKLGEEYGRLLSAVYAEVRGMISPITATGGEGAVGNPEGVAEDSETADSSKDAKGCLEEVLIRMELFVEIYSAFVYEWQENQTRPSYESIRQILYWYVSDYTDIMYEWKMKKGMESGFLWRGELHVQGSAGTGPNPQYDYDHKDDLALVWDKALQQRKAEVMRTFAERHG